ncbi:nudix hydrolase homolog 3 [Actinidia rufa]|uniref:Nudix hydrolase homolog 3 n=1 Tax=Actinidia rufa TaxID=165716 RepID=A0A7J0FZ59_9ERIC|nr:nudix hydrolase homolog 3 [Actinidia rufa]
MAKPEIEHEEHFDVLTRTGQMTGVSKPRGEVHRDGDYHRAVHVWIFSESTQELLLQRRADCKDSWAGFWDISSAGHISAGDSSLITARRELHEELGVILPKDAFELIFIFLRECVLNDGKFIDNEYDDVYLVTTLAPIPLEAFTLQESEVSAVKYIPFEEYKNLLAKKDPEYVPYDVNGEYGQLFDIIARRYKENMETRSLALQKQLSRYACISLGAELEGLTEADKEALALLIKAGTIIDDIFHLQVWYSNPTLRDWLKEHTEISHLDKLKWMYYRINKSPWSSLDENESFLTTADSAVKLLPEATKPVTGWKGLQYRTAFPMLKPPGANFYPQDMDKREFELWMDKLTGDQKQDATGFFSVIKRQSETNLDTFLSENTTSSIDHQVGFGHDLYTVPYSQEYKNFLGKAAELLHKAGDLISSLSLKRLLHSKADAFLTNDYYDSDIAWMELDSKLDVTIGPYETYEDAIFGYKSSKGVMSKAAGILMQKLGVVGHSVWFSAFSRDFALQVDLHSILLVGAPPCPKKLKRKVIVLLSYLFVERDSFSWKCVSVTFPSEKRGIRGGAATLKAVPGTKATFELFVGVRDDKATAQVKLFGDHLQVLEQNLPMDNVYKSQDIIAAPIRVIQLIYNSGDVKGPQTVAFNLPNDERIVKDRGTSMVMLKNVSEAKFKHILQPIAEVCIAKEQQDYVDFDSFFTHTICHECCHGIGPHSITLPNGEKSTVRLELQELHSALEEAKADIVGLWALKFLMVQELLPKSLTKSMYVSFLAGCFRSVRFGLEEAHGKGQALQFNWLFEKGAFIWHPDETFSVDFSKVDAEVESLSREILTIQAKGDKKAAEALLEKYCKLSQPLKVALKKLENIQSMEGGRFQNKFASIIHDDGSLNQWVSYYGHSRLADYPAISFEVNGVQLILHPLASCHNVLDRAWVPVDIAPKFPVADEILANN